jgi:uncharacterized protein YjcR
MRRTLRDLTDAREELKEAAEFLGVRVGTLRGWRSRVDWFLCTFETEEGRKRGHR